jgi:hypothetical protein
MKRLKAWTWGCGSTSKETVEWKIAKFKRQCVEFNEKVII